MIAIRKVDVGMAAPQKHRAIARRRPAKMMGGRIARRIRFGLHDTAGNSAGGKLTPAQALNRSWFGTTSVAWVCVGNSVGLGAHGVHSTESAYSVGAPHNSTKRCMSCRREK